MDKMILDKQRVVFFHYEMSNGKHYVISETVDSTHRAVKKERCTHPIVVEVLEDGRAREVARRPRPRGMNRVTINDIKRAESSRRTLPCICTHESHLAYMIFPCIGSKHYAYLDNDTFVLVEPVTTDK